MSHNDFQIIPARSAGPDILETFFHKIKNNKFFHPHPLDGDQAKCIWLTRSKDIFYVIEENKKVIGYGFLRGFKEGWKDVCLGIYILDRGKGLGELLMHFLHIVAKREGLKRLRLHVHPDNKKALNLYKKTGYKFSGKKHENELIGYKTL